MKIILQKPVEKLGVPGDIVDVADGYARNFLVPRGLAVKAEKAATHAADASVIVSLEASCTSEAA